jgi:hypothetical protein
VGKKRGVSKTEAILNYAKENPGAGPSAIASALGQQGIDVSAQYVSSIRSKHGVTKRRRRRGRRGANAVAATAASGGGRQKKQIAFDSLLEAKKFVHSLGGVDKARTALEAFAKLQ